jgi:hypothetical protein
MKGPSLFAQVILGANEMRSHARIHDPLRTNSPQLEGISCFGWLVALLAPRISVCLFAEIIPLLA